MNQRLSKDGRFGAEKMILHLSQNDPFTPIVDAWNQNSKTLLPSVEKEQKENIRKIRSHILSNRQPPYSITGGVYDALSDSKGRMYAISNDEALRAGSLFQRAEGCDLDPAGEVALASLARALEPGRIGKKDLILLKLTGEGYSLIRQTKKMLPMEPDIVFSLSDLENKNRVDQLIKELY